MAENEALERWIKEFYTYAGDGGGAILDTNDCAEILKLLVELKEKMLDERLENNKRMIEEERNMEKEFNSGREQDT